MSIYTTHIPRSVCILARHRHLHLLVRAVLVALRLLELRLELHAHVGQLPLGPLQLGPQLPALLPLVLQLRLGRLLLLLRLALRLIRGLGGLLRLRELLAIRRLGARRGVLLGVLGPRLRRRDLPLGARPHALHRRVRLLLRLALRILAHRVDADLLERLHLRPQLRGALLLPPRGGRRRVGARLQLGVRRRRLGLLPRAVQRREQLLAAHLQERGDGHRRGDVPV
mmetsp:Transcript_33136/g.101168  ORF Transcript_33136/g.101168 Transcript_33136/m.101168 type:complete len:226 (+) Transcript_33136:100-777(+)